MKKYNLFENDEGAVAVADIDTLKMNKELSERFLNHCLEEIDWIVNTVKTIKQDDEDVFNSLYRRSRLISGLSKIHHYQRLNLLLEVLVFCTDYLRHKIQYKASKRIPHNISYPINLK